MGEGRAARRPTLSERQPLTTRSRLLTVVWRGRRPLDWAWVTSHSYWLVIAWFAVFSGHELLTIVLHPAYLGSDARLYDRAAAAIDPYAPSVFGIHFAGPPPSLVPFVLLRPLGEDAATYVWTAVAALSAVWAVRRLGLPWWWLLFPPLVEGVMVGNHDPLVLALLLGGGALGGGIAVLLKVYAAVPLLLFARWRSLGMSVVLLLLSALLLPWASFLRDPQAVVTTLAGQTQTLSGWGSLSLMALVLGALVVAGRERAAWLAVPALWPATHLHYAVLALPALTPLAAAAMAVPVPHSAALGALVLGGQVGWDRWHSRLLSERGK